MRQATDTAARRSTPHKLVDVELFGSSVDLLGCLLLKPQYRDGVLSQLAADGCP